MLQKYLLSRCSKQASWNYNSSVGSKRSYDQFTTIQASFHASATTSQSEVLSDRVKIESDSKGICHVTLNRPEKLNALDMEMFKALSNVGQKLKEDKSVRVVIMSGAGRAFCTGLDVPSFVKNVGRENPLPQLLDRPEGEHANLVQQVGYQWRQINVPVIACLHGMCFGGGMQIALGADFRFATPDCKLSIMETKWGLIPDMSASVTLRELVSIDVAKEFTMTGKIVSGDEAACVHLITRAVADPLTEAQELAERLVERSPDAVALSKQLYQSTWRAVPEEYCLTVETELQRQLLLTWNQVAAAGRNFGWKIPYFQRKK
ncbi:hypothetical protein ACA910_017982 [Epithemia clementina (nom. ined.)]